MSRRLILNPYWVVEILIAWSSARGAWSDCLGYPKKSAFLLERVDGGKRSSEDYRLWGYYSTDEYRLVDEAMHRMQIERHELYAACIMKFRPGTINQLAVQGYPVPGDGNKTYYNRLKESIKWLEVPLEPIRRKTETKIAEYA